jgi:hypothetical protein
MKFTYRKLYTSFFAAATICVNAACLNSAVLAATAPRGPLLARSAARDFGPVAASAVIAVTVHLKRPNEALFERTVDALYDRSSPTYHQWLSDAQLAQFGPTAAQLATVRSELQRVDRPGWVVDSRRRHRRGDVARLSDVDSPI